MYAKKIRHYAPVRAVADRLLEERKLSFQPQFLFPIISALGFLNDDMKKILKVVVQQFADTQVLAPPRWDGLGAGDLKGRFKVELKNSLCFALIKGNTLAMHNQGELGIVHAT